MELKVWLRRPPLERKVTNMARKVQVAAPKVLVGTPKATPQVQAISPSFDQWWVQFATKYKVNPALKTAMALHLKARGFWASKQWNAGAQDFGYKLK
jgi:hypothetical protein